jgi:hypothetical protein
MAQVPFQVCVFCCALARELHMVYWTATFTTRPTYPPSCLTVLLLLLPRSTIFTALVDWWFKKYNYQAGGVSRLARPLVAASLEMYGLAQRELLPTPAKSHYTFNLRDVSKVFQVRQYGR